MTSRELEEYAALRATIRERGSLRVTLFLATFVAWGAATIATAALAALPAATLLPLLLLAAGFEGVFSLHTGVERIGRYLQVFYEADAARNWERTAMAYGRQFPGGPDPLFSAHFTLAAALNFMPVLLANPLRFEWSIIGLVHILFGIRIAVARRSAGRQRALDLERFERLRDSR